jgi:hypothetical protein
VGGREKTPHTSPPRLFSRQRARVPFWYTTLAQSLALRTELGCGILRPRGELGRRGGRGFSCMGAAQCAREHASDTAGGCVKRALELLNTYSTSNMDRN